MPTRNRQDVVHILPRPAFFVEDGTVTRANHAAAKLPVYEGIDVRELLGPAQEEYAAYTAGHLYLNLPIEGKTYPFVVTCVDGLHLFSMLEEYKDPELKAMAVAGQHLLDQAQATLHSSRQLMYRITRSDDPSADDEDAGSLKQQIYRMIRSAGNMVDASGFTPRRRDYFVYADLKKLYDEAMQKLHGFEQHFNRRIEYTGLTEPLFTMMDPQALERAFYNLFSNAVKYSPPGSTIQIHVKQISKHVQILLTNNCAGSTLPISRYYDYYLRHPGEVQINSGVGLGITVVQAIANAHDGAIYIRKTDTHGVTVSMTVGIAPDTENHSLTDAMKICFNGGFDTVLTELSDILPPAAYDSE